VLEYVAHTFSRRCRKLWT